MLEVWAGVDIGKEHHCCVVLDAQGGRLRRQREFRPTMSAAQARQAAENADGAAYADAVSECAALGRDELREAARPVISGRG
ncbi:hypothetical protein [Streptomyces sp. NPDC002133]|uniref:hypothetical protein n=1 Tax=Streptomyces sp. NPDC002133 TaxID=3154409 RepID=UPI003320B938